MEALERRSNFLIRHDIPQRMNVPGKVFEAAERDTCRTEQVCHRTLAAEENSSLMALCDHPLRHVAYMDGGPAYGVRARHDVRNVH